MRGILRNYTFIVIVCLAYCLPVRAELPDISQPDLVQMVSYADSLVKNIVVNYSIDEAFNKEIHTDMPAKRHDDIIWKIEGEKWYYDVNDDDRSVIKEGSRGINTWQGEKRMQYFPHQNKGDVFGSSVKLSFPVPIDFGMTLGDHDKMIGQAMAEGKIDRVSSADWQGNECYYVVGKKANGSRYEAWIDPKAGWRARKVMLYDVEGRLMYESWGELKDCGNGMWFPIKGQAKMYANDKKTGERVISATRDLKVADVKLNTELTVKDFEVEFPKGTRVFDHIYGMGYKVGETSLTGVDPVVLNEIAEAVKTETIQPEPPPAVLNPPVIEPNKPKQPLAAPAAANVGKGGLIWPWAGVLIAIGIIVLIVTYKSTRARKS